MIITKDTSELTLSNVGTTGEFKIRNSAKAFSILSSGLYSNKVRAIVRELSTNALDSHMCAGHPTMPFEVHLPTYLEPWFAVRDFGTGLDDDQVTNIYTTYFESTKADSNAFIGALGLGSKSPFSYTENFTVTAIKSGIKRIYSAFINETGVPSIASMGEELTDEANGVEVKFSVTDRYDYQSFRSEALHIFKWFKVKPIITGVPDFIHTNPEFRDKDIIPGVHSCSSGGSLAIMGNIAYPLNAIPGAETHFGQLSKLLECNLVIEFNIGELDIAASREQLSYIPLTINSIRAKLENLNNNLIVHLEKKVSAIENEWLRACELYTEARNPLFRAAVDKYVTDTKFELYDVKNYHGYKKFSYSLTDMEARGFSVEVFFASSSKTSRVSTGYAYVNGVYTKEISFAVASNAVFVINDLKTGCLRRAWYHFSNEPSGTVYCITHTSDDPEVRQAEYDKLLKELHSPHCVVKASTLRKRPTAPRAVPTGILVYGYKSDGSTYAWVPPTEELDENKTYNFVYLKGNTALDDKGDHIDMNDIKYMMANSGIKEFEELQIYGVRKSHVSEIKDQDNWVWFEDSIKEIVNNISDAHIVNLVTSSVFDGYSDRVYTSKTVAYMVGEDSDYAKFVKEYSTPRSTGSVQSLVALCKKYGKTLQVDSVIEKIRREKAVLYRKYPLLEYVSSRVDDLEIANYIKLIDKQEKN